MCRLNLLLKYFKPLRMCKIPLQVKSAAFKTSLFRALIANIRKNDFLPFKSLMFCNETRARDRWNSVLNLAIVSNRPKTRS